MTSEKKQPSVLFVCLGNYCRSPAAEGVFRHLASFCPDLEGIEVESCGVLDAFLGRPPDQRMSDAAKRRGIILTTRSKVFQREYFDYFDYILPVTSEIVLFLKQAAKHDHQKEKIKLMTDFSELYRSQEIPDPFYQDVQSFDLVLDMIEDCSKGLICYITEKQRKSN